MDRIVYALSLVFIVACGVVVIGTGDRKSVV